MNSDFPIQKPQVAFARESIKIETESNHADKSIINNFFKPWLSSFGASFGLASLILSSVIAKAGLIVWISTLLISLFVNYISFIVLLKLTKKYKFQNFIQLADLFDNPLLRNSMKLIYFLLNFGLLLTSCLVFNSLVGQLFRQLGFTVKYFADENAFAWAIILHLSSLPLLLKRKLSELSIITIFSLFSCLYIIVCLVVSAISKNTNLTEISEKIVLFNLREIPKCYFINFFIFSMQINLFSIYNELPKPSLAAIRPVIWTNFGFLTIVYIIIGFSGYVLCIDRQELLVNREIILRLMDDSQTSVLFASSLMILTSLNSFFFSFKPTKDIILKVLFEDSGEDTEVDWNIESRISSQSRNRKSLNTKVTFSLMIVSLASSIMIIVYEISFTMIIDFMADLFMPCLFIFIPLIFYLQRKKNLAVGIVLAISLAFYLIYFLLQLL